MRGSSGALAAEGPAAVRARSAAATPNRSCARMSATAASSDPPFAFGNICAPWVREYKPPTADSALRVFNLAVNVQSSVCVRQHLRIVGVSQTTADSAL